MRLFQNVVLLQNVVAWSSAIIIDTWVIAICSVALFILRSLPSVSYSVHVRKLL